jgi:hypothetical protein
MEDSFSLAINSAEAFKVNQLMAVFKATAYT